MSWLVLEDMMESPYVFLKAKLWAFISTVLFMKANVEITLEQPVHSLMAVNWSCHQLAQVSDTV